MLASPEEILDTIIWGNSLIRKNNKPIFTPSIVNSNIDKILDIYNLEKHKFFTYQEIIDSFGHCISFLDYCSILAAIPNQWKLILKGYQMLEPIDIKSKFDQVCNSKNQVSKNIYWHLIEARHPIKTNTKIIWETNLNISLEDEVWNNLFPIFLHHIKPTKLRFLQFRILTNSLTTNLKHNKWDSTISPNCSLCNKEIETITHLLFNCTVVQPIWTCFSKMLKQFLNIEWMCNAVDVCLNNYSNKKKHFVNLLIIILKHHIYVSKCKGNTPSFMDFMTQLSTWHNIDVLFAQDIDNVEICKEKWSNIF